MNLCAILCAMLSTSLLAQQATNTAAPPADPAPAAAAPSTVAPTNQAPAKPAAAKSKKKAAARKPAVKPAPLRSVPLVAGPAVVVANNVNIRGKAGLNGEVVGRLTRGEVVNVLGEVTLKNSGADEPSAWARIQLPPTNTVWVHSAFVDSASKTVKPRRLNFRGGPGENYSVLGQLEKGQGVAEMETKGDWLRIQAPTNAFAFIAAQYLSQEAAATNETPALVSTNTATTNEVASVSTNPPPTTASVGEGTLVATNIVDASGQPVLTNGLPPTVTGSTNAAGEIVAAGTNDVSQTEIEEPPPKRVVAREGVVRGTVSIQAPTKFALVSPETGRLINYLFTTSRELDLQRYKGMRIIVSGEEALEQRWGNTPVLTIQKIQVLE